MKIPPNGNSPFIPVTTHCQSGYINKTALITGLMLCTLALIPLATASNLDSEAYKICINGCISIFSGADRGYDACITNCAARYLSPW